jgi:hypothetical protein
MSKPIDILESATDLAPDKAQELADAWQAETGRRCVILGNGIRYGGTIEVANDDY